MILTKDALSKVQRKGRLTAITLLSDLSRAGGLPDPYYEYRPGGFRKKPSHYHIVKFRIPQFWINMHSTSSDEILFPGNRLVGSGRDTNKQFSKTLAALEVVHQLEFYSNVRRNTIATLLQQYKDELAAKQKAIEEQPLNVPIPGVAWTHLPWDRQFSQDSDRKGRIHFFPNLVKNARAFAAAKAVTLMARKQLPQVAVLGSVNEEGVMKKWANIRANGRIQGISFSHGVDQMGESDRDAELFSCMQLGYALEEAPETREVWETVANSSQSTFGMAKLFIEWPQHQVEAVKELVDKIRSENTEIGEARASNGSKIQNRSKRQHRPLGSDTSGLQRRIDIFRNHQKQTALQIDSLESQIPFDAPVTILRGGTGSGKTSRYPLMLSLFCPTPTCRVVVAQPRRLACTSAANRVAFEQDTSIGTKNCHIGYAIRFDSQFSTATNRTVDFVTPGVLLRQATSDPLLSSITHLVLDEVHERNADVDLLIALAKQAAQERRQGHSTLPPLHLVLMSATLDSEQWEKYFADDDVAVLNVPDVRRFPIDIVHLGESRFPVPNLLDWLPRKRTHSDYDEALCRAMADVVLQVYPSLLQEQEPGSMLCFLPGMEEIRNVAARLNGRSMTILPLHSTVAAKEQAKVFRKGPKVILSTNLAETSVTIPDVKIVIDSGRERQFSMLDPSSDTTTVVGSQLVTVNTSKAAAKQRAGRAGRVSAGICYRLYTEGDFDSLESYTKPEILRMDLSQMVVRTLSLYQAGRPLRLLEMAPDPPPTTQLTKTVQALRAQGLVSGTDEDATLTPLGNAVSNIPASPRLGRMLVMGLLLRAIEPALTFAALLSVPRSFGMRSDKGVQDETSESSCSDLVKKLVDYGDYISLSRGEKGRDPRSFVYKQVTRVRDQLAHSIDELFVSKAGSSLKYHDWNTNGHRVGAQAALIVSATPHIAHLVSGSNYFATRDLYDAVIHPNSNNYQSFMRVHWYVYHELRKTSQPFLNVTTAVSPLDIAMFSDPQSDDALLNTVLSSEKLNHGKLDWLFVADDWVPVDVAKSIQRADFMKLKHLFTNEILQHIAQEPAAAIENEDYNSLTLHILSALEQQRLKK